jgi:hypothetical protein
MPPPCSVVEAFEDGRVARNSIALEEQHGDKMPFTHRLDDVLPWVEEITREQFEEKPEALLRAFAEFFRPTAASSPG